MMRRSITPCPVPGIALLFSILLVSATSLRAQSPAGEYRGLWADAWNSSLWTGPNISQTLSDLRAGNLNTLVAQVRRRGDALYNSHFEPKCKDISPAFDPLADMIAKAHDPANGRRIDVHAWLVTYHIWTGSTLPTQPDHPLNLHPDWLLKNYAGSTFIDNQYTFDPGHPAVQLHTYNVAMDIVTNYDVDGINFDYIRYSGTDEGYNAVTVARFNRLYNRVAVPQPDDPVWKQFRRDQITALLRKIYLNAIALKPGIKISCDTITWTPAPVSDATWYSSSAAWNSVLQDWRGWMQEGIMDLNIPMAYFRQTVPAHALAYTNWSNFTKDRRFGRHAAIGPAIYLNSISNSIAQMRQARQLTATGNRADGMVGYSYAVTHTNANLPKSAFLNALVGPSPHDAVTPPIFSEPADPPAMPWKTAPSLGHLKGFVRGPAAAELDGATMALTGPVNRTQVSDATGFYGFVNLPPGTYTVSASFNGFDATTNVVTISAGAVSTSDLGLKASPAPVMTSSKFSDGNIVGQVSATPGRYGIDWTSNMANWYPLTNVTTSSNEFRYVDPASQQRRFYRARRLP